MKDFIKTLAKIILPCIFVVIGILFFMKFITLFIPFIIAWFISLLIMPLVKKINKKLKLKNKFLNKIIILFVITAIIAIISFIGYKIIVFLPQLVIYCKNELMKLNISLEDIIPFIKSDINFDTIKNYISEYSSQILNVSGKLMNIASNIPDIIIKVFVTIMATYYFVVEEFDINKILTKFIPETFLKNYEVIKDNAKTMFSQYFIAQFKITGVIFVILFIGFIILGVKNSFMIAFLTAILDMLPVFGTGAVLWPWALYHVFAGNYGMALGLMVVYLISQGFRQIIQPKLIGDTVGISSIATLFFMYVGFLMAGIGGMIIAVPIGVFVINLIKAGLLDDWIMNIKHLILIIHNFLFN